MSTKWTPGPWSVCIDDDGNPLSGRPSVQAADEYDCAIVHWDGFVQEYWRSARGDKEIHANAHLIAAAPELYEALKDVLRSARKDFPRGSAGDAEFEAAYGEALAALRKARGEA